MKKLNPFTVSSGQIRVLIYLDRLNKETFTFGDLRKANLFAGYPPRSCRFGNLQNSGLVYKIKEGEYGITEDAYKLLLDFEKLFTKPEFESRYSTLEEPNG